MKKVTIIKKPGTLAYYQAMDEAIEQGWNCYSKPYNKDYYDYITDTEEVFYYSKNLLILEVTVKKNDLQNEIKKTVDFFAEMDKKIYGEVTEQTKKIAEVQNVSLPEDHSPSLTLFQC